MFAAIYRAGGWHSEGSTVSGYGSNLKETKHLRAQLPGLLEEIGVTSVLDAPCGDFFWMNECELPVPTYIGIDIVPELIESNLTRYRRMGRTFEVGDLVVDDLPPVDLILCRDCLVHLRNREVLDAIRNFKESGSSYLLTTTFTNVAANPDLDHPGNWRPINLMRPPFDFPKPLRLLNEGCTELGGKYSDKSLGLWRLSDLAL